MFTSWNYIVAFIGILAFGLFAHSLRQKIKDEYSSNPLSDLYLNYYGFRIMLGFLVVGIMSFLKWIHFL